MKTWLAGALSLTRATSGASAVEPGASPLDATLRGSDAAVANLEEFKGTLGARPWGLPKKMSTVMLLDATGTVVYTGSGRLDEAERQVSFTALSRLLGVDLRAPEGQP